MSKKTNINDPQSDTIYPEKIKSDTIEDNSTSSQTAEDLKGFKSFNWEILPDSFTGIWVGSRRSGKGVNTNFLIQEIQKNSKTPFNAIFLFSTTDAGYKGIPSGFRYNDLEAIDNIIEKQKEIKRYNETLNKYDDPVISRVLLVIDDHASGNSLRSTNTLNDLFLNGRHISGKYNSLSVIVTTQSLTAINRKMRLNSDVICFNSLSSRQEQMLVLDECFFVLGTSRKEIERTRQIYHKLVSSKPFRFIVVGNFISNKRKLEDYIFTYDAKIEKDFQFFGNKMLNVSVDNNLYD